jgi:hypothetical protein
LTKTQNRRFQEKEKRTNCKDLGVGQNLTEFVKISILGSFVYLFFQKRKFIVHTEGTTSVI